LVAERGDLGGVPVAAVGENRLGPLLDAGLLELGQRGADHRLKLARIVGALGQIGGQDDLPGGRDRRTLNELLG
jgi:hypothetical protein